MSNKTVNCEELIRILKSEITLVELDPVSEAVLGDKLEMAVNKYQTGGNAVVEFVNQVKSYGEEKLQDLLSELLINYPDRERLLAFAKNYGIKPPLDQSSVLPPVVESPASGPVSESSLYSQPQAGIHLSRFMGRKPVWNKTSDALGIRGLDLDDEIAPGDGKQRYFDLMVFLESEGRLAELFKTAIAAKPGNPHLRALLQQIAEETNRQHIDIIDSIQAQNLNFTTDDSADAEPVRNALKTLPDNNTGELQALAVAITGHPDGLTVDAMLRQQQQIFRSVCLIRLNGKPDRTGILIGPDRVITCFHSLDHAHIKDYDCVFDYRGDTAQDELPENRVMALLASNPVEELDFAILQLSTPETQRKPLCIAPHTFNHHREPMIVVGHPSGHPMRTTVGVLMDNNNQTNRIAYSANTESGSSGSAVLTSDYALVALHHHGQKNMNNHGIPFGAIYDWCESNGGLGLLKMCHNENTPPIS